MYLKMSLNFFFAALFSAILAFIGFFIGYAMANDGIFEHSFGKLPIENQNYKYAIAIISFLVIIIFFSALLAVALAVS